MTSAINSQAIYPVYCHELSPTIGKWCPLRAVDLHALRSVGMILDGKKLYHYGNHPIKWVRITGVIVAIDRFFGRLVYTVDDSSGECVECTCSIPPPPPQLSTGNSVSPNKNQAENKQGLKQEGPEKGKSTVTPAKEYIKIPEDIDVGSVVKVKGLVTEFRDMKQIEMRNIVLMKGTEEEVKCWNQSLEFRRDILSQPWVVEPAMEEKMRRRSLRPKRSDRKVKDGQARDLRRMALDPKKALDPKRTLESKKPIKDPRPDRKSGKATPDQAEKRKERDGQRLTEEEQILLGDKKRVAREDRGLKAANRANVPSLAVRHRIAGKYDALGI